MTTWYSKKMYDTQATTGKPIPAKTELGVNAVHATFTVASNLTTGDTIEMFRIPAGATIVHMVANASASVGQTGQLEVGDSGDDNRYIAGATGWAASGAAALAYRGAGNPTTAFAKTYTADDVISIKALSIATPATGAVLTLDVIYTMNP